MKNDLNQPKVPFISKLAYDIFFTAIVRPT